MLRYIVTISASGLGGAAPADGFIDVNTVEQYLSNVTYTGTTTSPTVTNGDSFYIRETPVVVTGTSLDDVISSINNIEYQIQHHVIASKSSNKLVLKMLPGYAHLVPYMMDITSGITATLGFTNPVKGAAPSMPSLAQSQAKERANVRWGWMLQSLAQTSNIELSVIASDASVSSAATEVKFYLEVPEDYYHFNTSNVLETDVETAIKFAISHAFTWTTSKLVNYYDPTTAPYIDSRAVNLTTMPLEIGLLSNFATAQGKITLEEIE